MASILSQKCNRWAALAGNSCTDIIIFIIIIKKCSINITLRARVSSDSRYLTVTLSSLHDLGQQLFYLKVININSMFPNDVHFVNVLWVAEIWCPVGPIGTARLIHHRHLHFQSIILSSIPFVLFLGWSYAVSCMDKVRVAFTIN